MGIGKFAQALPLRRSRRVRGEGLYLRVDEGSTGSRRDTQNVRLREEALAILRTRTVCITVNLSIIILSAINKTLEESGDFLTRIL